MIVSCPSCNVLYRQVPPPVEAILAHCSKCDERFEVEPARAAYKLVPRVDPTVLEREYGGSVDTPEPPPVDEVLLDGMTEAEEMTAAAAEAAAESIPAGGGSRVSGYGVALGILLAGVATGSGYYLSLLGVTDSLTGTAGGAGVGLLLAVAVIRWTMRAR